MKIPYMIRPNSATFVVRGKTYRVASDAEHYQKTVDAALKGDEATLIRLLVPAVRASETLADHADFEIQGGHVNYQGKPLPNSLSNRLLYMLQNGLPVTSLVNFCRRLAKNPSYRAVNELFGFLDETDLPITEDGCFIAYKKVRPDFRDIHSGKFDNSPGAKPEMPRNEVDEDPNRTCSRGLHVCSESYLSFYSGCRGYKTVLVKVDPADVVAVPIDYNNAKMRTCRYEVLREIESANDAPKMVSSSRGSAVQRRDARGRFC